MFRIPTFTAISATVSAAAITLGTNNIAQAATLERVATGLDNVRGITLGPDGLLYVTEAGLGGSGPCIPGATGDICYGETGTLSRLQTDGTLEPILTNLPSLSPIDAGGNEATGLHDISFGVDGQPYVVFGLGSDPANRADLPSSVFGQLLEVGNVLTPVADFAQFEAANNPDGGDPAMGGVDTNPYAFITQGDTAYVADAGGNDLLNANLLSGNIDLTSVFPDRLVPNPMGGPDIPMESVPTSVTIGPDGALYVGELTGFPFPPGGAQVYRIDEDGTPEVYASGFTNIIDLQFDDQENLYVLEYASNFLGQDSSGALVQVMPDQTQQRFLQDTLVTPTAFEFGSEGEIYLANRGLFAGQGELLRFDPTQSVPEPTGMVGWMAIALGGTLLKMRSRYQH